MALHAEGYDGDLDFDGTMVTITRLTGNGKLEDGGKSYPITSIGALEYRAPTSIRAGLVQFSVLGDISLRRNDKNAVGFTKSQRAAMDVVVDGIRSALAANAGPAGATPTRAASSAGAEVLEQLEMLGVLHANGVLTDEEFAAKKTTLLERL